MWVPGKLPPNFVFLITVTKPVAATVQEVVQGHSSPGYAVTTDAADEVAHLKHADGRQHAVDG